MSPLLRPLLPGRFPASRSHGEADCPGQRSTDPVLWDWEGAFAPVGVKTGFVVGLPISFERGAALPVLCLAGGVAFALGMGEDVVLSSVGPFGSAQEDVAPEWTLIDQDSGRRDHQTATYQYVADGIPLG